MAVFSVGSAVSLSIFWLVVSTPFKNISQNGNLPQLGVKIKHIWNHYLVLPSILMMTRWHLFQGSVKTISCDGIFHRKKITVFGIWSPMILFWGENIGILGDYFTHKHPRAIGIHPSNYPLNASHSLNLHDATIASQRWKDIPTQSAVLWLRCRRWCILVAKSLGSQMWDINTPENKRLVHLKIPPTGKGETSTKKKTIFGFLMFVLGGVIKQPFLGFKTFWTQVHQSTHVLLRKTVSTFQVA